MRTNTWHFVIIVTSVFLSVSCLHFGENELEPNPPQLELRNAQTRIYATKDVNTVMKATVNVLQDLGFIIKSADAQLGVITAEKWTDIPHSKKDRREAEKKEIVLPQSLALEGTINISPFGDQVRVRAAFQRKTFGPTGNILEARPVIDLTFYQEFFTKVDKGVFLELEGI